MYGAIIGDISGIKYEFQKEPIENLKVMEDIDSFSDDSVLSMALMDFLIHNELTENNLDKLAIKYKEYAKRFINKGFGAGFLEWVHSDSLVGYNSWGNGSAMRVSYIGEIAKTEEECLRLARLSALPTHDHPEGIKGAQAIALAVFLAKTESKEIIKNRIVELFNYDLDRTIAEIIPTYKFHVSCQLSVPEAIIAFLESTNFESAIYNAIILNGDCDTQACMAGAIAESFYKDIPKEFVLKAKSVLPLDFIELIEGI